MNSSQKYFVLFFFLLFISSAFPSINPIFAQRNYVDGQLAGTSFEGDEDLNILSTGGTGGVIENMSDAKTGSFFYELQCGTGSDACTPSIIFSKEAIKKYISGQTLMYPIRFTFNWRAEDASLDPYDIGDTLGIRAYFYNNAGVLGNTTFQNFITQNELNASTGYAEKITTLESINIMGLNNNQIDSIAFEIFFIGGESGGNEVGEEDIFIDDISYSILDSENSNIQSCIQSLTRDDINQDPMVSFGSSAFPTVPIGGNWSICYKWDFGDGTTSSDVFETNNSIAAPTHTYTTNGEYKACLTVSVKNETDNKAQCDLPTIGGYTNYDSACIIVSIENAPLPVELTRFTATPQSGDVRLDWSTATETNNDFFQVEHSRDGASFTALAQAPGNGDSQAPISYDYLHENAPAGINYYRLKQVDYDGAFEYSDVVTAQVAGSGELRVFPNPARDELRLTSGLKEQLGYTLFDATGRLVRQGSVAPQGDRIDLSGLPGGVYFLRVENERGEVLARERVLRMG